MYDSAMFYADKESDILDKLGLEPEGYSLLTAHRAENTNFQDRLTNIFTALGDSGEKMLLPMHPRLKSYLEKYDLALPGNIQVTDPVSYVDMIQLEKHSKRIVTDSGGVQKEAYFFKRPCVTLRDETEWVETVDSGWNKVVGADPDAIRAALADTSIPEQCPAHYGDGKSGDRITDLILAY